MPTFDVLVEETLSDSFLMEADSAGRPWRPPVAPTARLRSSSSQASLRQVSLTGGIPFRVALPEASRSVDVGSMTDEQVREVLLRGLGWSRGARGAGLLWRFPECGSNFSMRDYEVRVSPSAMEQILLFLSTFC